MNSVHHMNVDYRHSDTLHESTELALTNRQTTKYVTNNFHNAVYAFVVALFRTNNPANTNLDTFNQHNNVYFQDSSGNSLSNGIQYTDVDLRLSVSRSLPQHNDISLTYVCVCSIGCLPQTS